MDDETLPRCGKEKLNLPIDRMDKEIRLFKEWIMKYDYIKDG